MENKRIENHASAIDVYGYEGKNIPDYMNLNIDGYQINYSDIKRLAGIMDNTDIHKQYNDFGLDKAILNLREKVIKWILHKLLV